MDVAATEFHKDGAYDSKSFNVSVANVAPENVTSENVACRFGYHDATRIAIGLARAQSAFVQLRVIRAPCRGEAPSRNLRTLSMKKPSPLGKVIESAS